MPLALHERQTWFGAGVSFARRRDVDDAARARDQAAKIAEIDDLHIRMAT